MADETAEKNNTNTAPTAPAAPARPPRGRMQPPLRRKNMRRGGREGRPRQEFDQKLIDIRRVARVGKGGRRFNFSVAMIIGNRRGSVGVGTGKGTDTAVAIDKATRDAKKHMITVSRTASSSIPHRVDAKYSSARVMMMPAPGRGVVAGSALRSVLELAGVNDVTAKIFSPSKNVLNVARAAVQALSSVRVSTTGVAAPDTNHAPAPAAEKQPSGR